ncbi:hypothetical protein CTAYLR_009165 [Chrysophaeum taylorii]|uniref:EDRF1 N-terminal domain-containing protein n=1 Tax=Chrysophaeum taylorii TaxID=2483200 RepID=A0AAD7UJP7_9STRA|nr:hypothetical protein CTAYLR_009165 [Chrysophaeum taylorii]
MLVGGRSGEGCGVWSWRLVAEERELPPEPSTAPDFIGDAEAFKKLISLPICRESTTVAIHRVGGTLVVDGGDDQGGERPRLWPASRRPLNSLLVAEDVARLSQLETEFGRSGKGDVERLFLPGFCLKAEDRSDEEWGVAEAKRQEEVLFEDPADELAEIVSSTLAPPEGFALRSPPQEYARVIEWQLQELRLVSGSDVRMLRDGGGATLRLAPADAASYDVETRRLAVLDYYLENVLAGAPQLALCLERRGVVAGGRLVATSAIPTSALDDGDAPLFSPRSVELHAAALLRFVAERCRTDGATYVLRRDDAAPAEVKLFDVTALSDPSKRRWKWLLATLSVRFARRIAAHLVGRDAATGRALRRRQRLLLETALELLAEIDDLDGRPHYAMRCTIEENLARSYLNADLELARKHFELALDLAPEELPELGTEVAIGLADASLALAARHLEARNASSLMHDLRKARDALSRIEDDRGRAATVWRLAAAFATGVAADRYAWSDRGAHASDAVAFVRELGADDAPSSLIRTLIATCDPPTRRDRLATDSFLSKEEEEEEEDAAGVRGNESLLGYSRVAALAKCHALSAKAHGADSPRAKAASERLGDACNDVGQRAVDSPASAIPWFYAALCRLRGCGENEARVRLNLALAERRRAPDDETALAEALRHCSAARDALGPVRSGGLESPADCFVWDSVHLETANTYLVLGLARRRRGTYHSKKVLEPLEEALRVFQAVSPDGPGAASAHFQIGSYLASVGGKRARVHLDAAKRLFDALGSAAPRVFCAVELSDLHDDALASFLELLEPRPAVAALDPDAPALDALRPRLASQAKALLAHVIPYESEEIDVAIVGRGNRLLLHSSGIHGVEGFAGSAIQIAWLRQARVPSGVTVVLLHGVNAHGMRNFRRWTSNNVDLNRNSAAEVFEGEAPLYEIAAPFLNPPRPDGPLKFYALAAWLVLRHGFDPLKRAIAGGQRVHPGGLFYVGERREPPLVAVDAFLRTITGGIEKAAHVDVHTGLGRRAVDVIFAADASIVSEVLDPETRDRLEDPDGPTGYRIPGAFVDAALPDTIQQVARMIQEFGTEPPLAVFRALRDELALRRRCEADALPWPPPDHPIRKRLKQVFYPEDDAAWKASVLARGLHLADLALSWLAKEEET